MVTEVPGPGEGATIAGGAIVPALNIVDLVTCQMVRATRPTRSSGKDIAARLARTPCTRWRSRSMTAAATSHQIQKKDLPQNGIAVRMVVPAL